MALWVVDTGPFLHLDQIGHLRLLQRLPSLYLPLSVVQELASPSISRELHSLVRWPNVTIHAARPHAVGAHEAQLERAALHRGERDCLRLALGLDSCIFLTDDLAARAVAQKLGIEIHGTVGLIAYGVRQRWLSVSQAEDALKALYHRSSLFITYAIIERAIHQLRQAG